MRFQVQQSLQPQRAQLLKEREENLGALVAQLQIEKAKQVRSYCMAIASHVILIALFF